MFQGIEPSFNNLTGDIELNPSSFGLFMRDIEKAPEVLKTAIYNGNVELTSNYTSMLSTLSEQKYAMIDTDGTISSAAYDRYITENGTLVDNTMSGKDSGLYMNNQRLGYWDKLDDDWKAYFTNAGEMFLGSVTGNSFLHWDGADLTIRGTLLLPDGTPVGNADWNTLANKPNVLSDVASFTPPPSGSGFKLTNTHMGFYSGGSWRTYLDSSGNFGLSGSGSNYLSWNGSSLIVRGDIEATSINSNVTITNVVRGGKSTYYDSTNGYWLGYDSGYYKFYLGNNSNYVRWNGSSLDIKGNITINGGISWSDVTGKPTLVTPGAGSNSVNSSGYVTSIDASSITVMNVNASNITTGTLTGRTVRTSASGQRVELQGSTNRLQFYNSGGGSSGYLESGVTNGTDGIKVSSNLGVSGVLGVVGQSHFFGNVTFSSNINGTNANDIIVNGTYNASSTKYVASSSGGSPTYQMGIRSLKTLGGSTVTVLTL